jgi:hypothetical protein
MKLTTIGLLGLLFFVMVSFGACASHQTASTTTTTTNAIGAKRTQVTKDTIPAEGDRKIPVTEQY